MISKSSILSSTGPRLSHNLRCDTTVVAQTGAANESPGRISPRPNAHPLPSLCNGNGPGVHPDVSRSRQYPTSGLHSLSASPSPPRLRVFPMKMHQALYKGASIPLACAAETLRSHVLHHEGIVASHRPDEGGEVRNLETGNTPGGNTSTDPDMITSISFSLDGMYVVYGDQGGFLHLAAVNTSCEDQLMARTDAERLTPLGYVEAYQRAIDPLNSLPIEERVNGIAWLPQLSTNRQLLTINDKTIKLWKIIDRRLFVCEEDTVDPTRHLIESNGPQLDVVFPKRRNARSVTLREVHTLPMMHEFSIHSISSDCTGHYFISCDDLQLRLWCTDHRDESLEIHGIRPPMLDELTETIMSASYQPNKSSLIWLTLSSGLFQLFDLRCGLYCRTPALVLDASQAAGQTSSQSGNTSAMTAAASSPVDEHIIATRDSFTVKLWDMRQPQNTLCTSPVVGEHVRVRGVPRTSVLADHLSRLQDYNECILDRFGVAFSPSGAVVYTGTYGHALTQLCTSTGTSHVVALYPSDPSSENDGGNDEMWLEHEAAPRYLSEKSLKVAVCGLNKVSHGELIAVSGASMLGIVSATAMKMKP